MAWHGMAYAYTNYIITYGGIHIHLLRERAIGKTKTKKDCGKRGGGMMVVINTKTYAAKRTHPVCSCPQCSIAWCSAV